VARGAVQLLARSNRRAGCMTYGPGPWSLLEKTQPAMAEVASGEGRL
jgi:hypothetical protein